MRLRIFLSTSTLLFVLLLTSSQLTKAELSDQPLTSPISGPITSPITETPSVSPTTTVTPTPTTTPVPNGKTLIRGRVLYAFFRFFPGFGKKPANNVTVEAYNKKTHETFTDKTDSSGMYEIPVTPGKYFVRPVSENVSFFIPWERNVKVSEDHIKNNVNFTGYIYHFH